MTGADSVRHRTVRDYSKVTNERKRALARAWAGIRWRSWDGRGAEILDDYVQPLDQQGEPVYRYA
jgi:hypothetical protein